MLQNHLRKKDQRLLFMRLFKKKKVKIQSFFIKQQKPLDFYQFSGKLYHLLIRFEKENFNPPLMVDCRTSNSSNVKIRIFTKIYKLFEYCFLLFEKKNQENCY